jgi:hypothetical protein
LGEEAENYQQNVNLVNVLNYGKIWDIIKKQDLLHNQKDTSSFLKIELGRIEENTGLI